MNSSDEVRQLTQEGAKRWVNWRLEEREGGTTKVPYMPSGMRASSTEAATWSTYDEVHNAEGFDGIGIVFEGSMLGIDLDHVIGQEGSLPLEVEALVEKAHTYTEVSPSGDGLHLYLRLSEPLELEANRHRNFECYTKGRYFTVTGNAWVHSYPVRSVSADEAVDILSVVGYPWRAQTGVPAPRTNSPTLADQKVIELMFSARNGAKMRALYDGDISDYGGDDSRADAALCSSLSFWTGKDASQIERIWLGSPLGSREKTQRRIDYRKRTIQNAISATNDVYSSASSPTPTDASSLAFRLWTVGEVLSHDFGEQEWVIESIIPKQGVAVLSGNPGSFKSFNTLHYALSVARGTAVYDRFATSKGGVLIVDEEDHLRVIRDRLEMLGFTEDDNVVFLSQSGFKADNEAWLDAVIAIVRERGISLLVLDSLVRIHGQEENDASGMSKVFAAIQKIVKEGASVLATHHLRKQYGIGNSNPGQNLRGSSDILAAIDSHVSVEQKRDAEGRLLLKQSKLRQGEVLAPFEVEIVKAPRNGKEAPCGFRFAGDYDERRAKASEVVEALPAVLAEGKRSRPEIHEMLLDEFGKSAIDDGIKLATESGVIERVPNEELPKGDRRKAYYQLPASVPSNGSDGQDVTDAGLTDEFEADIEDLFGNDTD